MVFSIFNTVSKHTIGGYISDYRRTACRYAVRLIPARPRMHICHVHRINGNRLTPAVKSYGAIFCCITFEPVWRHARSTYVGRHTIWRPHRIGGQDFWHQSQ